MDSLVENTEVHHDLQVDEGNVEGAMRPVSARVSRQAFSAGEALSGDADLAAEIDALVAVNEVEAEAEAEAEQADEENIYIPEYAVSSRRGSIPGETSKRRKSRQSIAMELNATNSSYQSTHSDGGGGGGGSTEAKQLQEEAVEAEYYTEGPTKLFSNGRVNNDALSVEPTTVLESPAKGKRGSKVAPQKPEFRSRASTVSVTGRASVGFPDLVQSDDWSSGRTGNAAASTEDEMMFKSFPMIQDVKDDWEDEGKKVLRKPNFKAVGIRVEIFRIYDIVAAASHFTCDFEVFMEWCDPTIIGIHSMDSRKQPGGRNNVGCFDPQGGWIPDWTPHLLFHNQYDRLNIWCKKYHVVDRAIGKVSAKLGFRGQFYDVMDMKQFPFDRQVLHVVIASEHPLTEMEYVQHPSGKSDTMLYENLAEWSLYNPRKATLLTPQTYHDILGDSNVGFQRYILQIRVERRYMYFVYNVFSPIFLMSVLSLTTWAINPTIAGERLAATFTLLLSLIAFKFAIAQHIPLVPYLTYLDSYMCLAFLAMVTVAIQNAICAQLPEDPWDDTPTELQIKFDRYFFSIFGGSWVVFNVILVFVALRGHLFEEYSEIEDNDETRTVQAHPDDGEEFGDDPAAGEGIFNGSAARAGAGSNVRRGNDGAKFATAAKVTVGASRMNRAVGGGSHRAQRTSGLKDGGGGGGGGARRSNSGSLQQQNKGSIIGATR